MTNAVLPVQPRHQQYPQGDINQQRHKDVGFPAVRVERNRVREKGRTVFNVSITVVGFAYVAPLMSQGCQDNSLKRNNFGNFSLPLVCCSFYSRAQDRFAQPGEGT